MYAVFGASGHTGRATAEALMAKGKDVRVVVRDEAKGELWKKKGAEVAIADLSDRESVVRALTGVEGAFLLVPPQYEAEDMIAAQKPIIDTLAAAVRESGVPHVVLLSSVGAQHAEGNGPIRSLHAAEKAIGAAARNTTLLRAAYFLENWAGVLPDAKEKGVLHSFLTPGRAIPMVATQDIGHAAAEALIDPPTGTRVIELSGPADWTPEDVAAAIGKKLGREVKVDPLPLEAVEGVMTAAGLTVGTARLFREMNDGVNRGHVDFEGGSALRRRGMLGPQEVLWAMI